MPNLLTFSPEDVDVAQLNNAIASKTHLMVGQTPGADYYTDSSSTTANTVINAAIAAASAAGGAVVRIKAGIYTISEPIQMKSNVYLVGEGMDVVTIKAKANYAPTVWEAGQTNARMMLIKHPDDSSISNNLVRGITLDGNVQNIPGLTGTNHRAVWMQSATDFIFIENKLINTINWATYFKGCTRLWVDKNKIFGGYSEYTNNDGIHARNCNFLYVTNNYCDMKAGGEDGDDAIAVLNDNNIAGGVGNVVISGNIIASTAFNGIRLGVDQENIRNVVVSNNIVYQSDGSGITIEKYTNNSTSRLRNIIIDSNECYDFGSYGLSIVASSMDETVYDYLNISNNTFAGNASTSDRGIHIMVKGNKLKIHNNTIYGITELAGIIVGGTTFVTKDYQITDNMVDVSGGAANIVGIKVTGGERGIVALNHVYGNKSGTSRGISLEARGSATSDTETISNAEVSKYQNVTSNFIYNFDIAIAEVNGGADPDYNFIHGNFAVGCSGATETDFVKVGSNSTVADNFSAA